MDWLDLLAVQGTLKSLLQYHSSKASILQHSAFFMVQLSHPYLTTEKTIVLTKRTFVDKVMSLLFNILSRLVITFLARSKHLLISRLLQQSTASAPYLGKTIALMRQTFVVKGMSFLFNMLSRLFITFIPRSKHLLISWLQSPSAAILGCPQNKVSQFPLFLHLSAMKWWDQMPWS